MVLEDTALFGIESLKNLHQLGISRREEEPSLSSRNVPLTIDTA